MSEMPDAPATHQTFVQRYPELGQAWELISRAGSDGPLDDETTRLIKLGVAIGAMREGAVHASVRKALAQGIDPAAIEQVVALGAGTIGLPGAAATFTWIRDIVGTQNT